MQTRYRFNTNATDPVLCATLPQAMYDDLASKAAENGRTIDVELMIRLARTLEKDAEIMAQDELIEKIFTVAYDTEGEDT